MAESGGQEKTEKATPKKLQDARKKGQIAKSQDFNASLSLLAGVVYFYIAQKTLTDKAQQQLSYYFSNFIIAPPDISTVLKIVIGTLMGIFGLVAPLFVVLVLIAFATNIAQFGFMFSPEAIKPSLSKINPLEGLKKMFSTRTLFELLKSILKVLLVGVVVYVVAQKQYNAMLQLFYGPPAYLFGQAINALLSIMLWGSMAYFTIGVIDLFYQRYAFDKQMRMSKQEIKDEYKQSEGDPQIKSWIKRRQREILMNQMKQEVPKATVVITNPTHFAVALRYDSQAGDIAPMIVAKGADFMAQRIKEIAFSSGVPIEENKPVARFLYFNTEVGQEVPAELYQAVAEILAAVYRANPPKY